MKPRLLFSHTGYAAWGFLFGFIRGGDFSMKTNNLEVGIRLGELNHIFLLHLFCVCRHIVGKLGAAGMPWSGDRVSTSG